MLPSIQAWGPDRQDQIKVADAETYIDQSARIVYAPSEHDLAYWPLAGAGVLGQSKVRYSGTSVASAVVTRALISGMTIEEIKLCNKIKCKSQQNNYCIGPTSEPGCDNTG